MASVFLSYDREDADKARPIAAALEKAGHSVWWDRHIKGGAQYSKEIDKALKAADAVVVLWSERSVESAWVRDEAAAGRDSGRLVPVLLDSIEPPLGFRQYQSIDLSGWSGRGRPRSMQAVVEAVNSLGDKEPQVEAANPARTSAPPDHGRARPRLNWWLIIGVIVGLLILLLGLAISRPWEAKASAPTVVVTAADNSQGAQDLARDVLVQLGTLQTQSGDSIELVDETANRSPDLILDVSGTTNGPRAGANLVLLRGKDRQLLSSQELVAPKGETANLKTSVAVAATSAIGCATEALASRSQLPLSLLKQYLGACQRFAVHYGMEDVSLLIPQLEQVVKREPGFLPARKRLLLAGAFMRSIPTETAKPSPQWLRAQIDAARRIEPAMPELRLAEVELLPMTDFAGRMRIVDALREEYPNNMFVLGARAEQLMLVGRNNEAVVDAERAAMLDPLTPYSNSEYIRALAFSGRLSRALEELNRFDPISPVAMNLTDTRFRVNMRYGDPQSALSILRMYGTSKGHEAFLLARVEPTQVNIERAMAMAGAIASERGFRASHAEVLAAFGRDDEAYRMLIRVRPEHLDQFTLQTLFRPTLRSLREDARFLRIAQRYGLLDYWRTSGKWPDFCFEPDLPYDCKREAAKLNA